jgi:DNA-directed RNA polymerase subunit beta'
MDPMVANELMTKKAVGKLIDIVYRNCGQKATVIFCDRVMALGFKEAAKAGISFGKDDMVIPKSKDKLVADTRKLVNEYERQYADGLITRGEKFNKVVDAWSACTDKVADAMMDAAGSTGRANSTRSS